MFHMMHTSKKKRKRYLFLSTVIFGGLYGLGLEPVIGWFLAAFVFVVGLLSIYNGVKKSLKLENVRKRIISEGPAGVQSLCISRNCFGFRDIITVVSR